MVRTTLMVAATLLAFPAGALACPVCGLAGVGDNGWAYFGMTIMMSALPLAMIGGVFFWVRGRVAAADDVASAARDTRPVDVDASTAGRPPR